MRDMIVMRKPLIISKHIYAVAAILGSACYLVCVYSNVEETIAVIVSVMLVVGIRMLAAGKKLNLPKVKRS